jgi:hypothetical protein
MVRIGEFLFALLLILLMLPVLLIAFITTSFDIGHYLRIRKM